MIESSVWVVVPAYNEAAALPGVLDGLGRVDPPYNVVVVDDGSTDGTAAAAGRFPVHLLSHPLNLGQGAALATGVEYAIVRGAGVIVTFDADGQMDSADISRLVARVTKGGFDVALGSRFLTAFPLGMTAGRRCLLKLATFMTRLTTGLKITDTHNGMRAFGAKAARTINITQNRMAHASEILSQISRHGLSYSEVPVSIRYTGYSRSKGQSAFNIFNIIYELFTGGGK